MLHLVFVLRKIYLEFELMFSSVGSVQNIQLKLNSKWVKILFCLPVTKIGHLKLIGNDVAKSDNE